MDISALIEEINFLKNQIDQLKLNTRDLLRLVPRFRLDWGTSEDNTESEEYNIGVTKPILLSRLADPSHKLYAETLLSKDNKIGLLLADAFFDSKILTNRILLRIHSHIVPNGGRWRAQDVFVSDKTYALGTFFSDPQQIERLIGELVSWYNNEAAQRNLHPLVMATIFHYNFVRIHPFLDGNGRLARVMSSLILLADRLPPPVVRPADRQEYLYALRKADLDDLTQLTMFIGKKVLESMKFIVSLRQNQHE